VFVSVILTVTGRNTPTKDGVLGPLAIVATLYSLTRWSSTSTLNPAVTFGFWLFDIIQVNA